MGVVYPASTTERSTLRPEPSFVEAFVDGAGEFIFTHMPVTADVAPPGDRAEHLLPETPEHVDTQFTLPPLRVRPRGTHTGGRAGRELAILVLVVASIGRPRGAALPRSRIPGRLVEGAALGAA